MVLVERAMADFPKDSSLDVSMDVLKTNTLRTHTTLKGVMRFRISSVVELDLLWARSS